MRRALNAVMRLILLTLLVLTAFVPSASLEAHALGQTRVSVHVAADRTYTIDILIDPESLLGKLQILAGQEPAVGVPVAELPSRISALREVLLANTHVTFDGVEDHPVSSYLPGPAGTPPTATVRLTGRAPASARAFQFTYGLVLGAYPLTFDGPSAQAKTVWLTGGQTSEGFALADDTLAPSRLQVAGQYLVLGFEHIVPKGIDHILFVLGIFLLSTAWRPILLQVTTFTIAHSITLGLTIYGLVSLPSAIVEPLIALSITYVAVENLFTSTLRPWRVGLVFAFGLLHGMGFAGVLKDLGLPRSEFLTALVTFNLGVEAGQLAVIGTALIALGWWRRGENVAYRRWVVVPASVAIAAVGAYWTIARAFGGG